MDKLYRAILMTLPIDQKGSVARTYRRELAKLESQGRAKKTGTEWARTVIGDAYVKDDLDQIMRPARAQSSAPPPPVRESGMFRVTNHVEPAPAAPPAPAREPSGQLWVRMPQAVLDVIEARAKAEGQSRSEIVRTLLEDVLTRPESARKAG
jgi:hypothetical protein